MTGWHDGPRSPWVSLVCANRHDHVMAPAQAELLEGTPCPWCGLAIRPQGAAAMSDAEYDERMGERLARHRRQERERWRAQRQKRLEAEAAAAPMPTRRRQLAPPETPERRMRQYRAYRARKALEMFWAVAAKIPA